MVRIYRVALTLTGRCNGPGIRCCCCGILTTITMDEVLLTVISFDARPTGSSVAQLLVERINEKNQRSAAGLYIAPGFAHMRSIVSAYGLL